MTLVLDSGGVSALAARRALLDEMRRRGRWPALVPSVVLAESLTGDHRRDHGVNRFLSSCQVLPVGEAHAREAARLRTATGRAGAITATDAIVVAVASTCPDPLVLTSDRKDLDDLAGNAARPIVVVAV